MKTTLLIATSIAGLLIASNAYARTPTGDETMMKHSAIHKHHVARYHNPAAPVSDVPQESAAPAAKPDEVPEYFNHAVGSDGSM